ncbi:hypothetical protein [Nisaea sp.]|uniref:hypothetical protein n=1 Tax=Nisaea sp. TaxID=2024842 RepID=UPI003264AC26
MKDMVTAPCVAKRFSERVSNLLDQDRRQLERRVTTARIFYRLPDYPDLLQCFIWQTHDVSGVCSGRRQELTLRPIIEDFSINIRR